MRSALLITLACGVLLGCASLDPHAQAPAAQRLQRGDALGECARLFQASDRLIDAAGTRDAQSPRIPGFPHLRVDRLLAQLAPPADAVGDARAWRMALAALDEADRRFELANAGNTAGAAPDSLAACRQRLVLADHDELPALLAAARVPDDYSTIQRALGLYPLTRYAFAAGIRRWQQATLAEFVAQSAADPHRDRRLRYVATAAPESLPALRNLPELGLPEISQAQLARLIDRHAPRLAIETASDDDRPGALAWQRDAVGRLRVGVSREPPVLYVRTAHAQLAGQWLLQLSYTAWFPARPPEHAWDLLAGRLDGLLWRVTLSEDGTPLVYDTIHPCGCYHLFIPTDLVRVRAQPESIDEGVFAPQTLRAPAEHERVVLRLAAATHYLQQVDVEAAPREPGIALTLRDDDELRALPLPEGGTRSAFAADGLIAGSERGERLYFWPMGIVSAGQMRQWGRHATAFVGRRHFDDPTLLERAFERLPLTPLPPARQAPR